MPWLQRFLRPAFGFSTPTTYLRNDAFVIYSSGNVRSPLNPPDFLGDQLGTSGLGPRSCRTASLAGTPAGDRYRGSGRFRHMADLNCDVLLQVEKGHGAFECWAFSGVPATRPSWIALVSTGSIRGLEDVADLATEMKAILENSSPEVIVEEILCPEVPSSMNPADYPSRRKLLVLVAAEGAPFRDTAGTTIGRLTNTTQQ